MRSSDAALDLAFNFSSHSKSDVAVEQLPTSWIDAAPAYLPTRELLTIYPGFVSIYDSHYLEFEETWRDTCILLGAPLKRGVKERGIQELLEPLEGAMGGSVELDKNGRFYLRSASGRMEMPLVAEGLRKLAMLARLVATGALLDEGCLFWDEPEANLNPRVIKRVAHSIVGLSEGGSRCSLRPTASSFFASSRCCRLVRRGQRLQDSSSDEALAIDPADVQQDLNRRLRPIDAHPVVAEIARMGSLVWSVA